MRCIALCPQVQACACAVMELLGQACKSCAGGDVEVVPAPPEAAGAVIDAMSAHAENTIVQAHGVRALLSLSGCLTCRCYYDRYAVPALACRVLCKRCSHHTLSHSL